MNQLENVLNTANSMERHNASSKEFKKEKTIYWIGIILISLIFFTSGFFEITKNPIVWDKTINLGYPPYFILLLGVAKISGVIVLLIPNKLNWLKEWVFVGLFYDVIFAFLSQFATANYSECVPAIIAFIFLFMTYIMFRKINPVLEISF